MLAFIFINHQIEVEIVSRVLEFLIILLDLSAVLTFLNKLLLLSVEKENFERLTEKDNDFQKNNTSFSNQNSDEVDTCLKCLTNDQIDETYEFSVDFVECLLCVFRIDRVYFLIIIQSFDNFKHRNKFKQSRMI